MFPNFQQQKIQTSKAVINTVVGGKGRAVLLLHGYPQTYYMWHKIAPQLAENFTVVATDLRGYGDSSKPVGTADHSNYSKRAMAQDQVEVMSQLGFEEFFLVGHDRGARVAHRLVLDYPQKVKRLVLLDIVSTYQLYLTCDRAFATAYYHWFFLIQPAPFPETLIGKNPDYFLNHCLHSWSDKESSFSDRAKAEYSRCFNQPQTIHATCEDYRASASIDLLHDEQDLSTRISCPTLVLWGEQGIIGKKYDVLSCWQERAVNLTGVSIDSGHFIPEENPQQILNYLHNFLQ